ncbi:MAG TPA: regulatory protein RecX [Ktedonobacterales bacterium]
MSTITIMQPAERADAWHISLDGRYAFTLDTTTVAEERLAVGKTLDGTDLDRLRAAADDRRILDAALAFLAPRPRSREEIRRRLLRPRRGKVGKEGYSPEAIERVLEKLDRMGLIDDAAFAAWWAEQRRSSGNPHGTGAIQSELARHGVDREIAREAAATDDDEALAFVAARRKVSSLARLDWRTFEQRLSGYLMRRGFAYSVTRGVVRALWQETHGGLSDDDESAEE